MVNIFSPINIFKVPSVITPLVNFKNGISVGTNPATTGLIRLPNNQAITARNAANTADANLLYYNGANSTILNTSATGSLAVGDVVKWNWDATTFYPFTDNAQDFGDGAHRLRNIFAVTATFTAGNQASGTTYRPSGLISVQTSSVGIGNGADATDDTLFTYSLTANSFDSNVRSIRVRAYGKTAANANNKQVKLWFAGTTIVDSGVIALNNSSWSIEMEITRIDATHVSCIATWSDNGLATADVNATLNLVVADLSANGSIVKVTGASTVAAAANDVLGYGMKVNFEN